LAEAAHGAGVAEEIREGGLGFDQCRLAAWVGAGDDGAALLQVADEIAEILVADRS